MALLKLKRANTIVDRRQKLQRKMGFSFDHHYHQGQFSAPLKSSASRLRSLFANNSTSRSMDSESGGKRNGAEARPKMPLEPKKSQ